MALVLLLATLLSGHWENQPARYFEGKMVYTITHRTATGDTLNYAMYGMEDETNQTYWKGADYVTTTLDGNPVDLYRARDNKFYSYTDKVKPIGMDASVSSSIKQKITLLHDTATIAGYFCQALQLETDHGVSKIFYTSELQAPSESLRRHVLHNLNVIYAATKGGHILKSITKWNMEDIVVTTEVISVKWQQVPESIFQKALMPNPGIK
jgi:hypothetical protein